MKFLIFVALILSIFACSYAAESVGFFRDPAHPGKCVVDNVVVSPGKEAKMAEGCGRILCGNDSFATLQTCGLAMAPDGCEFTDYINISAPYPDCCEQKLEC